MIAANALSNCSLVEVAQALGSEPQRVLATRAYGCLANIFEDISRERTGKRMRNCRAPKNAPFLRSPWTPRTLAGIPRGCCASFSSMVTATNSRFTDASLPASTAALPGRRSRLRHFCSRSGDVHASRTRRLRTQEEIHPRIALGRWSAASFSGPTAGATSERPFGPGCGDRRDSPWPMFFSRSRIAYGGSRETVRCQWTSSRSTRKRLGRSSKIACGIARHCRRSSTMAAVATRRSLRILSASWGESVMGAPPSSFRP